MVLESGQWVQKQKLQPADLAASDYFGHSVAISGEWAIVGAPCADLSGVATDLGTAYLFQLEGGEWKQKQRLRPSDVQSSANFGYSVAISNN